MATRLPKDANAKRAVLYSETASSDEKNALALAYIEAERYGEALEFLALTRDVDLLLRIKSTALELGDTFLLSQVARFHADGVSDSDWTQIEQHASSLGRELDAKRARQELGIEEAPEEVEEEQQD